VFSTVLMVLEVLLRTASYSVGCFCNAVNRSFFVVLLEKAGWVLLKTCIASCCGNGKNSQEMLRTTSCSGNVKHS
jgi:hypothetical protein